jgi:SET family sugar efflux transporter-like MFS transporter
VGTLRAASFFWGIQFSLTGPMMALLLVSVFHASTAHVGLAIFIGNLTGIAWGWFVPRRADKKLNYLAPVAASAVVALSMAALLSIEHSAMLALVTYVVMGSPAAVGYSLVFAYARHLGLEPSEIVSIRSYNSMAWIAGPPLATIIISQFGGRYEIAAIGLNATINLIMAIFLIRRHARMEHLDTGPRRVPADVNRWELAGLMTGFGLFQAATMSSMTAMTLFATETLHLSAIWGGCALSIAAGLEVVVLLWLRRSADAAREFTLVPRAALFGGIYYLVVATSFGGVELLSIQVLNAIFVGVIIGSGLTLFQRVVGMPGAASAMQSNASRTGALLGGPILALGSNHWIGLRAVYLAAAVCALLGGVAIELARRSFERRSATSPLPLH